MQAEFARRAGLKKTTFAKWVQRVRREPKARRLMPGGGTPRFVEVRLAGVQSEREGAGGEGLSLSLPDGAVVRGGDPPALAALVRALRAK